MKIAVLLPSLSRSATITVAFNIADGLVSAGHEVDILYFDDLVERPAPIGCAVFKVNFFDKIDFSKYDVLHSHNLRPDLYVAVNRKRIKCVCVSTVHNYVKEELENYHGKLASFFVTRLWLWAWRKQDRVVCLTRDAANYYKKLLPGSTVEFVYNGVALADVSLMQLDAKVVNAAALLKQNNLFVLGTYCNQTKGKGLDQIVRLVHRSKELGAVIIGSGPETESLMSLAKELDVELRCIFIPFTVYAYAYNQYFDAYIIPSRREGFGISLVEAALSDAVLICSDIPVFREMFDGSEVAFFKLDDIEGLLTIIDEIRAGTNQQGLAKKKAKEIFSINAMVGKYLEIYTQALKRLDN
ncbi:glycosyltransferase family 4 protein [Halopseudomonas pelagia]|uniref:Glycosyltransferase n=1 Tax=Halopseudomonas pelagia TaxID=553151 RepID=A0AA91U123_9GAMM|nr:glycosyltransferase family 4 protein [Halopseudomonas pelagia]PCC98436.1 hypothetical protein CO192_15830 [Halopseudomonas pelagia]QFY57708.1 glycosyltransferase [Halopseudomonas pelagia]